MLTEQQKRMRKKETDKKTICKSVSLSVSHFQIQQDLTVLTKEISLGGTNGMRDTVSN